MMSYSSFMKLNRNNPDLSTYQYWYDSVTYIRGAYDLKMGKGIEQILKVSEEHEVDKRTEDLLEASKYQD